MLFLTLYWLFWNTNFCDKYKVTIIIIIIIKIPIAREIIKSYTTLRESPKCNNASKKSHVRIISKFVKMTLEMFKVRSAQRNWNITTCLANDLKSKTKTKSKAFLQVLQCCMQPEYNVVISLSTTSKPLELQLHIYSGKPQTIFISDGTPSTNPL